MLTPGEILKTERERQSLTLEEISAATKINKEYLAALENNDFTKFPSSVHAKGFLQSYAKYLGINTERVLALYRRSLGEENKVEVQRAQTPIKSPSFVLTPGIVVITIISIIVVVAFGYLIYQFYNFQKPPLLQIDAPENNIEVEDSDITIQGTTEPNMFVTINDEPVKVTQTGTFEATVALSKGNNTIIIKSRHPDNIGKEAVTTLSIKYAPPEDGENGQQGDQEEEQEEEVPEITELKLRLNIGAENAWIEVEVDGEQVFASVAPAQSTYTYTGTQSIYVRTGKLSSTTVKINGEKRDLIVEGGGVASIICELEDEEINCHQP